MTGWAMVTVITLRVTGGEVPDFCKFFIFCFFSTLVRTACSILLADIGNAFNFFQANLLYIISIQHRLPFAVCVGVAL
jgi:hypothetical protein